MVGSVNVLEPDFHPGVRWGVVPRWCPPIGRRIGSPSLRHLHYPAVVSGPGSFLSVVRSSERPRRQHLPGPSRGRGRGHPGMPDRRPLAAWPNCRPCAGYSPLKFIGGLSQTAMGATLALVPRPRYGVSASLWCRVSRFWAVIPPRHAMVRAVLCWRRLRDPLQASTPPGSGLFCRKTCPNLTLFRGSGRLFRFLAAIRVDGYGITPGQKHSHRRCPVPQPTKPPRTLLRR